VDAFALALLALLLASRAHRRRKGAEAKPVATPAFLARTVADVAFDYERALLDSAMREGSRDRLLAAVAQLIVPLVGSLPVDQLTPELAQGVRDALVAQGDGWAAPVWVDMLGLAGYR
jgi:hypothetical protein